MITTAKTSFENFNQLSLYFNLFTLLFYLFSLKGKITISEKHFNHFHVRILVCLKYLETFKENFKLLNHYFFVYFHPKNLDL